MEMPFILVKSEGGPYDDDSFAAGFTAGRLFSMPANLLVIESPHTVHRELLPQLDLVAMHHGLTTVVEEIGDDAWVTIAFFEPAGIGAPGWLPGESASG
jgi:hypothetical protein